MGVCNLYTVVSHSVLDIAWHIIMTYLFMIQNEIMQHIDTKHTDGLRCKGLDVMVKETGWEFHSFVILAVPGRSPDPRGRYTGYKSM